MYLVNDFFLASLDPFGNGFISYPLEDEFPRLAKMYTASQMLEKQRMKKLREKKFIGHRTRKGQAVDLTTLVTARPVKFRWQRTTKIGELHLYYRICAG